MTKSEQIYQTIREQMASVPISTIARYTGINRNYLAKVKSGEANPTVAVLSKIEQFFDGVE